MQIKKLVLNGVETPLTPASSGVNFTVDKTLNLSAEDVLSVATPIKGTLTLEAYNALPETEKANGVYFITEPEDETAPPEEPLPPEIDLTGYVTTEEFQAEIDAIKSYCDTQITQSLGTVLTRLQSM